MDSVKVRTGIPGFDSIISGGFKEGRTVILSGPPGGGKTTFGMQFIHAGAKDFDEPGIFVTLSESPDEIKNDFKTYGWDVQKLIEEGKLKKTLAMFLGYRSQNPKYGFAIEKREKDHKRLIFLFITLKIQNFAIPKILGSRLGYHMSFT